MVVGETYSFVDQTFERLTILDACTTVTAFDHSFKALIFESAIGHILIVARHALFLPGRDRPNLQRQIGNRSQSVWPQRGITEIFFWT